MRCERIGYIFPALGCTGQTAQRRRIARISHLEHNTLPALLRGGEGDHVSARFFTLVVIFPSGIGVALFGIPVLTLGNSDIGIKANIALKSRFLNYDKTTGKIAGTVG